MQKIQQLIVVVGIVVIVLMGLYPPWLYIDDQKIHHPMGYGPVWNPPIASQRDTANFFGIKFELNVQTQTANAIDLVRLLAQIAIVAAVAGGAVVLLKRSPA